MTACPICKRPLVHPGSLLSATTQDGRHAVIKICKSCALGERRLPRSTVAKRRNLAAQVAIDNPDRYGVEFFDSKWAATAAAILTRDLIESGTQVNLLCGNS